MAPQDAQPAENSLELALELAMYEAVDTALSRSANSAEDAAIGTDHLLFGLLAACPDVDRELSRLGLASHAVKIVSRRPPAAEESQASAEDEASPQPMTGASSGLPPHFVEKMNPVTPSVLAALQRAELGDIRHESGKPAVVALLTTLLLDEQCRAADVLTALRVDPAVARSLLHGRAMDTPAGPGPQADLLRARSVLLGVGFYDARTPRQRFGIGASTFAEGQLGRNTGGVVCLRSTGTGATGRPTRR